MKAPGSDPVGVLKLIQPLIESRTWDYCVVWELGDDPSRFIEWSACSCVGSYGVCENVKMENGQGNVSVLCCRDTHVHHPVWTTACQALARFPSSISLYSGIHGEVAISNQARWIIIQDENNNSHLSKESGGTRVVIPVVAGLIELYSRNQIPRDDRMIKLIISQHSIMMSKQCPDPFNRLMVVPSPHQETTCLKFEGSSISSSPLSHSDPNSFVSNSSHPSLAIHLGPKRTDFSKPVNDLVEKDVNLKSAQKTQKEYRSKNLVTERNRRTRIKDGLYKLRSAVPNITKMDKASILGDAVKYIEDLKKMAVELQVQLDELDKQDDYCAIIRNVESKDVIRSTENLQTRKQKQGGCPPPGGRKATKTEVELSQINAREFSLKVLSEKRRGGLTRLLEAVCYLGLQVIDANATSFEGKSLTILTLQVVNKVNNVELKSLRDSLRKIIEC